MKIRSISPKPATTSMNYTDKTNNNTDEDTQETYTLPLPRPPTAELQETRLS